MPITIGGGITITGAVNLGRFVLPDPEVPQPNFPNPDFEFGLDGWTAYNNAVYWAGSPFGEAKL